MAVVVKEACIAWDWKGCTVCVEACPQEAITLDDQQRPVVDDETCDGCGLCQLICPASSLRSYSHSEADGVGIIVIPGDRSAR